MNDIHSTQLNFTSGNKAPVCQDYFKTYSSNMFYVLGLWWAKGSLSEENTFDITLPAKDKFLLKQISKQLGAPIQGQKISFCNAVIYNDIRALGGTNKDFFPNVPNEYLPDFIRGYFDGNGCITKIKGDRLNVTFNCVSKNFLSYLLLVLKNQTDIIGGSSDIKSLALHFGKRDTVTLGKYMYKNNPELFLERKKNKFVL